MVDGLGRIVKLTIPQLERLFNNSNLTVAQRDCVGEVLRGKISEMSSRLKTANYQELKDLINSGKLNYRLIEEARLCLREKELDAKKDGTSKILEEKLQSTLNCRLPSGAMCGKLEQNDSSSIVNQNLEAINGLGNIYSSAVLTSVKSNGASRVDVCQEIF